MADDEGPFFLGAEMSFADVMLAPMYDRFRYTLPAYRGIAVIPTDHARYPWAERFAKWARAVEAHPAFQSTSGGEALYIQNYAGYAGKRGVSKFGK